MILGSITSTCLTCLDCTDHKTNDEVRSNRLQQDLKYILRYVQNVIKYTFIKLYNSDIYNQSMFIE